MDKIRPSNVTCWALALLGMALVLWIRLLPQSLLVADDWADRIARRQLHDRIARELPREAPPSQREAQAEARVQQWIDAHQAQFEADKAVVARRFRSELSYPGGDGREHTYLGDFDSYLWLRHARNDLRTGTPCDVVVDGVCRDTYTNAPVGAGSPYARSLHIAAIVGVHRLITRFRPDYPLPASAFWVPVIIGVLGVPPAFFIARALSGTVAGPVAVVLTAVHPIVLSRSIGSDNDVWNVVLPLYMMWAVLGAMAAHGPLRQSVYAGLAGVCAGLQAWNWRGWLFAYTVLMIGLVGAGLLHGARYALRQRTLRIWQGTEVRRIGLVIVVLYVAAGVCTSLAGSEERYLTIPARALKAVMPSVAGESPGRGGEENWPNALTTVAELVPLQLGAMGRAAGGAPVFLAGLVGLVLLLLPRGRSDWWPGAVLLGGTALVGYGLIRIEPSRLATMGLLSVPLSAALVARWWSDEEPDEARSTAAFVLIVWFLAAVYMAYDGIRYLLLLAVPLGIAYAVAVGELYARVRRLVHDAPPWYRATVYVVLGGVLTLAILSPLRWGYAAARTYTPSMHDAWWDTLTRIRDTARPEAIVHTWWDYGHWVKYVAERPVSNDGSSLSTHLPHWLGKALTAPSERESVGVLRMLSCGSDATPSPEGKQGAYGKLRGTGRDAVTAYAILADLVTHGRTTAEADLARRGFTEGERGDILRATHCDPPEAYLILSSKLLTKRRSWMSFGLWDPRRAHGATQSRLLSQEDAVAEFAPRVGPGERESATAQVPFLPRWLPCRPARDTADMACEIQATLAPGAGTLQTFVYNSLSPPDARLRSRQRKGGTLSEDTTEGAPSVVVLAGAQETREITFASPTHPDLGVLIDVPNERILVGAPPLLQSTFVHLMYLDGRYTTHYEKFDDRTAMGERVATWKIHWIGK